LKIVSFDDSYAIKDAAMEVVLYRLRGSTHSDGMLMAYFPRQRFLVESDHWYGPPGQIKPHMRSLYGDIKARGLQVDRMAVLHGNGVYTVAELEKSYADWCCRTTSRYGRGDCGNGRCRGIHSIARGEAVGANRELVALVGLLRRMNVGGYRILPSFGCHTTSASCHNAEPTGSTNAICRNRPDVARRFRFAAA
jgi:hypothetical protein